MTKSLAALIFDVDGTLAETEDLHRRAFNETFMAFDVERNWPDACRGWQWDVETYRRLLRTTGGKERIAAYLRDDLGIETGSWTTEIAALHRAKTARYVQLTAEGELALRPGIARIIDDARAQGLKLAVATTTSRANVDALAQCCFGRAAVDVFDAIAAGDEVATKKPAPDVYHLALTRLGLPASACLALEDSAMGIQAAKAAGLVCVASPSRYLGGDDLRNADLVVAEFAELSIEALKRLRVS